MSAVEQRVPEGYKQTEVGVIPEDWKYISIGELNPFVTSGSRGWATYYSEFGDPFVRITNMQRSSIYLNMENTKFVSLPKDSAEGKRTSLMDSDILISITADIGICSYVDELLAKPAFINQHIALIRFENKPLNSKFIAYFLSSEAVQKLFKGSSDQGAKAGMNLSSVRRIKSALPEQKEQTAIANALSDVDALLTELETLITKKQAIKTATMQQLLTGKTRLPQFATYTQGAVEGKSQGQPKGTKPSELGEIPEDWEVVPIAKLTRNIIDYRGRTPKKLGMDWGSGDIVALSAGNVKKGYIDFEEECYLGSDALYKKWMKNGDVEQNDIVFTMEAPLGNVALIPGSKRYILSQRTILLQLNREKYDPIFVYQLMMSNQFQNLLSDSATGSTAQGIKRTRFEQLLLCLPNRKEEQFAIATILSDMDSEIQSLEQRLAKTHQIKQGMMQELLTGRIRLPFDKD